MVFTFISDKENKSDQYLLKLPNEKRSNRDLSRPSM